MLAAAAAAALCGAVYALSPAGVWLTLVLAALLWAGVRDLPPASRATFLTLALAALGLRYATLALLPLQALRGTHSFSTFFGDDFYNIARSIWLRNIALGVPIASQDYFEAFQPVAGRTGFQYTLAFVHLVFGPSPFAAQLVNVVLHTAGVVLLYRLARRRLGERPAIVASALLWFFPTMFLESVSALKEPSQFCFSVATLAGVIAVFRGQSWGVRAGGGALAAVSLLALVPLRSGSSAIVAAGLSAGVLLWLATQRARNLIVAAVAGVLLVSTVLTPTRIERRLRPALDVAVRRHMGHVFSRGESFRAFPPDRYGLYLNMDGPADAARAFGLTRAEAVPFLFRSAIGFLTSPRLFPLTSRQWAWMVPQQTVWYAALLFGLPGFVIALRRDPLLAWLLLGLIAAGTAIIAPNSGNIGTLIRHRDAISPFVLLFAAVGAERLVELAASRMREIDPAIPPRSLLTGPSL